MDLLFIHYRSSIMVITWIIKKQKSSFGGPKIQLKLFLRYCKCLVLESAITRFDDATMTHLIQFFVLFFFFFGDFKGLKLFTRYLSCGAWAGKLFCLVMIIGFLLWRLLQLWQVTVCFFISSLPFCVILFSMQYLSSFHIPLACRRY
jgi:hypothetical protein